MIEQALRKIELAKIALEDAELILRGDTTVVPPTETPPPTVPIASPQSYSYAGLVRVQSTPLIADLCRLEWMRRDLWGGIVWIAGEIDRTYSDRAARQLEITDACPQDGNSDHPGKSHADHGKSVDLHYYTRGATNHTQFSDKAHRRDNIIQIMGGDSPSYLFDSQRNLMFVTLFFQRFPKGLMRMDVRIRDRLMMCATKNAEAQAVGRIMADDPGMYQHDKHIHAQCEEL